VFFFFKKEQQESFGILVAKTSILMDKNNTCFFGYGSGPSKLVFKKKSHWATCCFFKALLCL